MEENSKKSLFRKESMQYIDSPEKMDQYLHVTSPGVWALLIAVMILLIGVIAWSVFGRIEAHDTVAIVTESGVSVCLVPKDDLNAVVENPTAVVDGKDITLAPDSVKPITVTEDMNVYVLLAGNLEAGDIVYEIPVETKLTDGVHKGQITTETLSPMSLLLN